MANVFTGHSKLASLLMAEDTLMVRRAETAIAEAHVITLSVDGWTCIANRSVYAVNLTLDGDAGRSSMFYDAQDF